MDHARAGGHPLPLDQEAVAALRQIILSYEKKANHLIQILHLTQALFGYLPDAALRLIGEEMNVPMSTIYGVVSFYSYFARQPKGRHVIQVCLGTACYVRGGDRVLDEIKRVLGIEVAQTTPDGRFSLEVKRCIGACGLAPAIRIGQTVHKRVSAAQVGEILRLYP